MPRLFDILPDPLYLIKGVARALRDNPQSGTSSAMPYDNSKALVITGGPKYPPLTVGTPIRNAKRTYYSTSGRSSNKRNRYLMNPRTGGFTGLERKFLDTHRTASVMSTTWAAVAPTSGSINSLSAVAQGNGPSEHIGRTYKIHNIMGKFFFQMVFQQGIAAPVGDTFYRLLVVLDTQTNSTAITAADVMLRTTSQGILAWRNLEMSDRFEVLYDTGVTKLLPPSMSEGGVDLFASAHTTQSRHFHHTFRKPIIARANGDTANVTSITDNHIMAIGISTLSTITCRFETRMRYTE